MQFASWPGQVALDLLDMGPGESANSFEKYMSCSFPPNCSFQTGAPFVMRNFWRTHTETPPILCHMFFIAQHEHRSKGRPHILAGSSVDRRKEASQMASKPTIVG